MADERRFRRIKGAIGNAFVFAAGWTVTGFIVWLALRQAQIVPPLSILDGIGMSIRVGFMGFITGAVFPTLMRYAYSGRRLSEINAGKFALVAGLITAVSAACLLLVAMLYKEFMVFSFDPGFAQAQGWPTLTLDLTMMAALALVTVVGLPTVGVVLMAAMLILPGAAARFWTNRLGRMLAISGVIGAGSGVLGTLISAGTIEESLGFDPFRFGYNTRNLPTGPVIVLCATGLFVLSMLFAPRRGVLARVARRMAVRRRIEHDHLLRSLYELSEPSLSTIAGGAASSAAPVDVTIAQLTEDRSWSAWRAGRLVRWAMARGLVVATPGGARLTPVGLERARRIVRAHRMWELFLISGADIAPDHVDRDADSIEHFLTPELVEKLEAELTAQRKLTPAPGALPHSPHALASQESGRGTETPSDA